MQLPSTSSMAMEVIRYENILPPRYKRLWSDWEIRVFVLSSLTLQVFLIMLGPHRKVRPSRRVRFIIWSFYLLADAVANFALGHLADNQSDSNQVSGGGTSMNHTSVSFEREYYSLSHRGGAGGGSSGGGGGGGGNFNSNVLAFWAPFLLLHLGGPDTITAFSLEDNELWLRHLLGLGFQLLASGYVLFRSLPHNSLLAPTFVMLLVGSIKYIERTWSLYLGSAEGFRESMLTKPDPGPMYFKLMDEYQSKKDAGLEPDIEIIHENELKFGNGDDDVEVGAQGPTPLSDHEAVRSAYKFFKIYKCLVVDLVLNFQERKDSRRFFLKQNPENAFKVISIELNFLYDVLYTKAVVIRKWQGYAFRATCTVGIAASFLMFFFFSKKGFHPTDVWITYALLFGAVALDILAFVMLVLSDWTLVSLNNVTLRSMVGWVVAWLNKKRWSEVVSRLDMIGFCLHKMPKEMWCLRQRRCRVGLEKIAGWLCMREMLDEGIYSRRTKLHPKLMEFIFQELMLKSTDAKDLKTTKKLIQCKGFHVLKNHRLVMESEDDPLWRSVEVEFDESVFLWHIATDLCYYKEKEDEEETGGEGDESKKIVYRELSKQLSEYMTYLLVMQPALMSAMGGIGLLRYRDTCQEAKLFFETSSEKLEWVDACKMLLSVTNAAKPSDVKGDRSKSVLFDGCILAKRLMELKAKTEDEEQEEGAYAKAARQFKNGGGKLTWEERWQVIAKVWVELLSFAACHCRGTDHARKLSTGGELLNLVWFLMAHLGLSEQFRTETGQARAKLVYNK